LNITQCNITYSESHHKFFCSIINSVTIINSSYIRGAGWGGYDYM